MSYNNKEEVISKIITDVESNISNLMIEKHPSNVFDNNAMNIHQKEMKILSDCIHELKIANRLLKTSSDIDTKKPIRKIGIAVKS